MQRVDDRYVFAAVCGLAAVAVFADSAKAFSYVFASESSPNIITHPKGYTGGLNQKLTLTVGVDSTSVNAANMLIPTQNAVYTWNNLVATTGNLVFGANNNIPSNAVDFESTALHEIGHALGLSHPNMGSGNGVSGTATNYTSAADGPDNVYNFNAGTDGIIGSRDDVRGDDVNLNWFRKSNNNPFTVAPTVDSTTYSRLTDSDLPLGDLYSANPDRTVGVSLGFANTESVLQQGASFDEAQRTLGHDDVAGIRYAFSGLDEIAGTADDYSLTLQYVGLTASADILLDFDDSKTGFAVTQLNGSYISGTDHVRVTSSPIYFNGESNWFFNQTLVPEPASCGVLAIVAAMGLRRLRCTTA